MNAIARGDDDLDSNDSILPTLDADDEEVMFLKFVPRMKQPASVTPIDLTETPTVQQLTDAGLNPGGWTKDYFKPKKNASGKYSHNAEKEEWEKTREKRLTAIERDARKQLK